MHRDEWVENADRLVAGFLEMFEEGCYKMVGSFSYLSKRLLSVENGNDSFSWKRILDMEMDPLICGGNMKFMFLISFIYFRLDDSY